MSYLVLIALVPVLAVAAPTRHSNKKNQAAKKVQATSRNGAKDGARDGAKDERPKLDRTKVVGAPTLGDEAKDGIYVWLEDGWFHFAALARSSDVKDVKNGSSEAKNGSRGSRHSSDSAAKDGAMHFVFEIDASAQIDTSQLGDFVVLSSRPRGLLLKARASFPATVGKIRTDGDLGISRPAERRVSGEQIPLLVGPLAEAFEHGVWIGRY